MLCYKCRNMHFKPYEDCSLELQEAVNRSVFPSLYYLHSSNVTCLLQTAASGCFFCKTICHRVSVDMEIWNDICVNGEQIVFKLRLDYDDRGLGSPCFERLTMYTSKSSWFFQCESDLPSKNFQPRFKKLN